MTNDDEVCIPSLSSILLAVFTQIMYEVANLSRNLQWHFNALISKCTHINLQNITNLIPYKWLIFEKDERKIISNFKNGIADRLQFPSNSRLSDQHNRYYTNTKHAYLGVIQQLRGQNCHFLTPPTAWTVFIPWAWTKTNIFWPPPPLILST